MAVVSQNLDLVSDLRPRREAEALAAAGFAVTLVGPADEPERVRDLVDPAVSLASFSTPEQSLGVRGQLREVGTAFVRLARVLRGVAREHEVDVLHAANPPDDLWAFVPYLRAVQGRAPRFVFDQHDVVPELLRAKLGAGAALHALRAPLGLLERASFRTASLVVFPNADYEARAARRGLLRVPSVVAPNGWSLPDAPRSEALRAGAERVVAYVGSIGEQDDVAHLVEAVARLRRRGGLRVVVAGDGPALADVKATAVTLGVDDTFEWLGWVRDRGRLAEVVRSADVCVAPERGSEFNRMSTLVKLIEYMSAGAAVAAHRLPSSVAICGEAVEYAGAMTAEALAGAIERLLENPARAAELGAVARERYDATLRWETVGAVRLADAYGRVFGAPVAGDEPTELPAPDALRWTAARA